MGAKDDKRQVELLETQIENDLVIIDLLRRIERNLRPARLPASVFEFEYFKITNAGRVKADNMKLQLNENAEIKVLAIKDAGGNPAKVDGDKLDWAVAGDLTLGTLVAADDGMSAVFTRNGKVGSCTVQVSGDADLGPDVKTIIGEVAVDCLGGEAVSFDLEANAVPVV